MLSVETLEDGKRNHTLHRSAAVLGNITIACDYKSTQFASKTHLVFTVSLPARESHHIPDIPHSRHPADKSLPSHSPTTMLDAPIPPQIEVPVIRLLIQPCMRNSVLEMRQSFLSERTADEFPDPGNEEVEACDGG